MFVFGGKFPAHHAAWINGGMSHARELPEILGSVDYAEGLAAYAEKRQPRFTGVAQSARSSRLPTTFSG
jgi:hypothetical protein